MNTLTTTNTTTSVSMSSIEIAQHTGKRHDHVLQDIRNMFSQLEIDPQDLGDEEYQVVTDYRGYTKEIFLNYRFTECLVTGYNPKLRLAVLDALKAKIAQLEQNTTKLPLTYLEALQCHLNDQLLLEQKNKEIEHQENQIQDMSTKIEQQEDKIQEDKPLVEFAQTISFSSTNLKMSEYAKVISKELGYGRNTLYKLLRDKKIYTTKNLPYQSYINKGYFVVVESIHNNLISLVVTITPLGQQKLLAYLKKHNT